MQRERRQDEESDVPADSKDLVVEEVSEDDTGHDAGVEIVWPYQYEDYRSDSEGDDVAIDRAKFLRDYEDWQHGLISGIRALQCRPISGHKKCDSKGRAETPKLTWEVPFKRTHSQSMEDGCSEREQNPSQMGLEPRPSKLRREKSTLATDDWPSDCMQKVKNLHPDPDVGGNARNEESSVVADAIVTADSDLMQLD